MNRLIQEIPGNELKNYVTAMKACRPGPTYELEGKYGILSFNFKDTGADSVVITMKRRSGNGIAVVVSKGNLSNLQIMSKISQDVPIVLDESGDLHIKRTQRSNGSIDIIKIKLFTSEEERIMDWASILRNCYSNTALRQIGNKLMASEGATISALHISYVQTNPPNMFKLNEDRSEVKFLGTCSITDLEVSPTEFKKKQPNIPLIHRDPDPQLIKSEPDSYTPLLVGQVHRIAKEDSSENISHNSRLLFDTAVSGFSKSFTNNDVKVFDKYIILGNRGEFRMPVRFVTPYSNYIIMVEASNIKGNGKFLATLAPSSDHKNRILTCLHHKQTFTKSVGAVGNPEVYELVVGRHPGSTGDMMITRVMFLADIVVRIKPNDIIQAFIGSNDISIGNVPSIKDPVLMKSLRYAKHTPTWLARGASPLESSFMSNSYSGLSWFNKISPGFPNIKIAENNIEFSVQTSGNIKGISKSVFIEECEPESITEMDIEELKKVSKVITPSQQMFNFLSDKLDREIELGFKPWPYIDGVKVAPVDDYILVFNRNPESTKIILEAIGDKKIVLAGARGAYLNNVFPINEYFPYKGLIHLIHNAKAIIDIPENNEYDSGLLKLCMGIGGAATISSNWKAMEYTEGAIYISPEDGKYPTSGQIKEALEQALERSPSPETIQDYIKEYNRAIESIFSS